MDDKEVDVKTEDKSPVIEPENLRRLEVISSPREAYLAGYRDGMGHMFELFALLLIAGLMVMRFVDGKA